MATYRITAPDGKTFNVSGSGTKEEALAHFKSTYAARNENYGNEGRSRPESSEAQKPMLDRLGSGVGGSVKKLARDVLSLSEATPVGALTKMATGDYLGGKLDTEVEKYENLKPYLGTAGAVGEIGTDIAATALPVTKAGNLIGKVPRLVKSLGRAAPAAGDVAANALYAGGREAAGGGDLGDVAQATALGGAGAAVPHAVIGGAKAGTRAVGNKLTQAAQRGVTPEARALLDEGIELTPGQMGGGNLVTRVEEGAKNVPFLGKAIERAQDRAGGQYVKKEIETALAPLEVGVKETGRKGLDEAHELVSRSYDKFLPDVHIDPGDLRAGLVKLDDAIVDAALTKKQTKDVYTFVNQQITPALKNADKEGRTITGREFKNIDNVLGESARKAIKTDRVLGEAYYELQRQLRASLSPARLGAAEDLKKTNQAFQNMLAVHKAGNREGGMFTPEQLRKQLVKSGGKRTELNKAATEVLTSDKTAGMTRNLLGLAGLGYGFYDPGTAATVGGAGLAASMAYPRASRALARRLGGQAAPRLLGAPATKGQKLRKTLAKPEYTRAAAQGGRMIATDDEEN